MIIVGEIFIIYAMLHLFDLDFSFVALQISHSCVKAYDYNWLHPCILALTIIIQ